MRNDKYVGFKRMVAFAAAIGLWGLSMFFSYKGFEFESTEVLWFGIVLAGVVTVVELVFNTKIRSLNPTLLVAGILCYIYGAYTNVTGFYILQHGNLEGFFSGTRWLIPVFAGLLSEVLPEALLAWAIGAAGDGDLVGNVAELFGEQNKPSMKRGVSGENLNQFRFIGEDLDDNGKNPTNLHGVNPSSNPKKFDRTMFKRG